MITADTTSYVCNQCFIKYELEIEECRCGNKEFIQFIDLHNWEFKSKIKGWLPKEEYIKRMKILSKFSEGELKEIGDNLCLNSRTNLEINSSYSSN